MKATPDADWVYVAPGRATLELMADSRTSPGERRSGVVSDASGVIKVIPAAVARPRTVDQVREQFERARRNGLQVTIAGTRHSGGGQSLRDGALLLDMRDMRGLRYDAATGALDVQPGATWDQVQRFLDPLGRAVAVQQSSNVFSVGGSLASNIHGRDVRFGPIIDSVESVRVLLSDGREVEASRSANPDLFGNVIGGYGRGGVIVQARLKTVPNEQYVRKIDMVTVDQLPGVFRALTRDPDARMLQVRLPVAGGNAFEAAQVIQFRNDPTRKPTPLAGSKGSGAIDFLAQQALRAMLHSDLAKQAAWHAQRAFPAVLGPAAGSRNQVMSQSAESLRSDSLKHRQTLQEYFVPPERIPDFARQLKALTKQHRPNLLNITLRWLPAQKTASALPYAQRDSVAAVLYIDQLPGADAQRRMDAFTRDLTQAAIDTGGSFYLPYQLGAYTPRQLDAAYPQRDAFLSATAALDPAQMFTGAIESIGSAADHLRLS